MHLLAVLVVMLAALAAVPAEAAGKVKLVNALSKEEVLIESNFVGTNIVLFGSIEKEDGRRPDGDYDVVVVVRGPAEDVVARRKERMFGIWVNTDSVAYRAVPSYFVTLSSRSMELLADPKILDREQIGLLHLAFDPRNDPGGLDSLAFTQAVLRLMIEEGLYREEPGAVEKMTPTLFRTRIPLPANISTGYYHATIHVFQDGELLASDVLGFVVRKIGFEAAVFDLARQQPLIYGILAVFMAIFMGWFAGVVFRRD